jgi:enamine deaminase RidA (YjgF/YER057c/UK114 family)
VDHDLDRLALVREIRDEVLGVEESPPASTLLGVQALAMPEFMVEVDAIAVVA